MTPFGFPRSASDSASASASASADGGASPATAARRPRLAAAHVAPIVLAGTLVLAGCTATNTAATDDGSSSGDSTVSLAAAASVDPGVTAAEAMAMNEDPPGEDGDDTWDTADEVEISLDGDTATVADDAAGVSIDGDTVTITAAGTYRLSGELAGQVVVDTADDGLVRIILDGVDISSDSTAALAIVNADRAQVVLADGSENTLSDTSSYAEDADVNAALFSAADLEIAGSGALTVQGNGNDGITSKDGLLISGGEITVDAVDDGIRGKDEVMIEGGTVTVTAGGDGLKADDAEEADRGYLAIAGGTVTVDAGGDGLDAATDVVIWGGSLDVTAGGGASGSVSEDTSTKGVTGAVSVIVDGGEVAVDAADDAIHTDDTAHLANGSITLATGDDGVHAEVALTVSGGTLDVTTSYEALEADAIAIAGGTISTTSSDDGLNAGSSLEISGGELVVDAEGDGLDSNGTIAMSGGDVVVNGPTGQGNGALDVDGGFDITGGTLVAGGSSGMAVAPDADAAQASVLVAFSQQVAAGTALEVVSSDGTVVAAYTATKTIASLAVSNADLVNGEAYTVTANGSGVGSAVAGEQVSGMGGPGGGMGGGAPAPRG
ncbi:carbohydrate-binding domain-containing protein [Agromyces sp. GXS1127]|uniref:carbohydrate-binding domain-containing protein n=1 Tax=Agromyces sp. GXS1127 TaxID=3424181 RepID=UPI003D322858